MALVFFRRRLGFGLHSCIRDFLRFRPETGTIGGKYLGL